MRENEHGGAVSAAHAAEELVVRAVVGSQFPDDLVANVVWRVELRLAPGVSTQRVAHGDERLEQLPRLAVGKERDAVIVRRPCEMPIRLAIVHDQRRKSGPGATPGRAGIGLPVMLPSRAMRICHSMLRKPNP